MKNDEFGDRMKDWEGRFTKQTVVPSQVLCVRIDGKGFSKFTKGFVKPFDDRLTKTMVDTTKELVKETNADIGYTSSDEITLMWFRRSEKQNEHIFGGKTSKINSILASMATANFNHFIQKHAPVEYAGKGLAYFDCRAWGVPTKIEASNVLLWRVQDARKNSISAMMRWTCGHKAMDGLSGEQMKEHMLKEGKDWNDLPDRWKYGVYLKRRHYETELSDEVWNKIPDGKKPLDRTVIRSKIDEIDLGYFGDISLEDRVNIIFNDFLAFEGV
jgi:tRNA(His) guanylyltransferase